MTRSAPSAGEAQARLVEEAGLNASAPRQQLWIDRWLVRFAPGKARRARCIQPVAAGRLSIEEKLARCAPVFAAAGLPLLVRVTPFSEPPELEHELDRLGYDSFDETWVMTMPLAAASDRVDSTVKIEQVDTDRFAEWVALARGSTDGERRGHAERLRDSPVRLACLLAFDRDGRTVAAGHVAIEGRVAGLYDVITREQDRGRGFGTRVCGELLDLARGGGANLAYLQVDASNARAMSIYRRLGFADAYSYRYRKPAGSAA